MFRRLAGSLVLVALAHRPVLAHQGAPDEGDTSLIHACQRTSSSGRVRMRFVSPTGTCPSNPAWQPVHWPKVPPAVAVQDISARVLNSVDLSIPNATTTFLTFDSEHWDTASIHSPGADCLVAPVAGKYSLFGHVKIAPNSTGVRQVSIQRVLGLNRALANVLVNAATGIETELSVSTHVEAAAGDCFKLAVYQTSGGALDVQFQQDISPEFGMVKVP